MPGEFFLTGYAAQLLSDPGPVQDSAVLEGLTGSFVSNIPRGKPIPVDGGVVWVPAREWVIGADGQFYEILPDGTTKSTPGITLTAHDPAFELTDPLQWQVKPNRFILAGAVRPIGLSPWWFNAPDPGWSGSIDQLTPVPGVEQKGGTRGPRGWRSRLVKVEGDSVGYNWVDETGKPWGEVENYTEIFSDSADLAVLNAAPGAITANIEARPMGIIADPEHPGLFRLAWGDALGQSFNPMAYPASHIFVDTDGVPYHDVGAPGGELIFTDTDGVPYLPTIGA